jgi:hypothetical protein
MNSVLPPAILESGGAAHLWSETYDRKFSDLFQLQDDLETAIVQAWGVAGVVGEDEHWQCSQSLILRWVLCFRKEEKKISYGVTQFVQRQR